MTGSGVLHVLDHETRHPQQTSPRAGRNKIDAVRTGARDCTRRTHASEEARHALWSEANEPRL